MEPQKKGTWQTVLYKPQKGIKPWQLSTVFLDRLGEALDALKPVRVEDTDIMPSIAVPASEVRAAISPNKNLTKNNKSLAMQIGRKCKKDGIRAIYNEVTSKDSILFQRRAEEE